MFRLISKLKLIFLRTSYNVDLLGCFFFQGTFLVTQIFTNSIIEHGLAKNASVVNISSIVGKYGNIGQSNYSASKAAVILLTKTASKELGKLGIRVNVILPGVINTPIIQTVPDKVKEKFLQMIPLGRLGEPEGMYTYIMLPYVSVQAHKVHKLT